MGGGAATIRSIKQWLRYIHDNTNIFSKVILANAVIVVAGSLSAVAFTNYIWQGRAELWLEIVLVLVGLVISLGVNYAILWLAFQPLFILQATLDRIRRGELAARVPDVGGDPDIARVTETANQMLDQLAEHRQAVAAQVLKALEDERKRIARELHDETTQSLTSVIVNLDVIERQLPELPEEVMGRLRLTKETAQRTLDETRRLMVDLRPSVLDDLGLVPALRWFISHRVQPMGLKVDFAATGLEDRLPEELETALFRIVQEAVTNALKHAKATRISMRITREPNRILGLVQDDGVGFQAAAPPRYERQDGGLGLFGMQERAALVGGSVRVDSVPGRGTIVHVVVPDRLEGR